ncbi:kinesin-like protein KIN-10B isoform X3 [Triticum dicoccoides]|uniref:kinesin-like protein KIN-10B isoform X3 n=1 Tax=Triticum dicoccoides TaxID=85692 RepID=UPI001890B006|nr:kinesin-like protein KIN-10B isoform X3 [Triticum dicoccoides]
MELGSSRSSAGRVGASAAQVQDPTSAAGRDRPDQRKVFRVADHAGVALAGLTAIFLHELQPILANHLQTQTATTGNTCVVACGAAAAKDHLFKGSQEQPGLVTIAMEEILRFAASDGGTARVSSYQVHVKSVEDFARLGYFDENQDKQQPTKASSTQQYLHESQNS